MSGMSVLQNNLYVGRRKVVLWLFKLIFAAAILAVLLRKFSPAELLHTLDTARPWPIILAACLTALNLFFQYKRWRRIILLESPLVSRRETLFSMLAGITLGMITPGRVGEFGRFFFVKNARWSRLFGFILVDKFYGLCSLIAIGAIGLSISLRGIIPPNFYRLLPLPLFVILLLVALAVSNPGLLQRVFGLISAKWPGHSLVVKFASVKDDLSRGLAFYLFGYSILQAVVYLSQLVLLVRAFSSTDVILTFAAAASIFITKAALPVAVADLGVRESAAIFYLGKIGVAPVAAFDASLLLFGMNLLLPGFIGLILITLFKPSAKAGAKEDSV